MEILILGNCGYIGSNLYYHLKLKHNIHTVDFQPFEHPNHIQTDYKTLSAEYIQTFDAVILLAAHSSVKMSAGNPTWSHKNNVANFLDLTQKLSEKQKLIYTSSAIYNNSQKEICTEEDDVDFYPNNNYDLTKYIRDCYSKIIKKNIVSLRCGTLNSCYPNTTLRTDIMINKMYHDVQNTKIIQIANPQIHRPILGIFDLCKIIEKILEKDVRGIYNVASFNATVEEIGHTVATQLNVPLEILSPSSTYDFQISTKKIEMDLDFKFQDTIINILDNLKSNYSSCLKVNRDNAFQYN